MKLSPKFSVQLIIDRVLNYLRLFPDRAADLRYEETLQFSLKWLFPELDIASEVAIYNKGEGYVDLLIITDEGYFVVELKNLESKWLKISREDLLVHSDLSQITYSSIYPPSGEKPKIRRSRHFKVEELLNAAKRQVLRYAEAVQRGGVLSGAYFEVDENESWVTIASEPHTEDIPIYPVVIILLGGVRVLSAELKPMKTRVRYLPGRKLGKWRRLLKTLNQTM